MPVGLNYNVIYNHRNMKTQRNPAVFLLTSAVFIFCIYFRFILLNPVVRARPDVLKTFEMLTYAVGGLAMVGLKCAASCNHRIMHYNLKMCRLVKKRGDITCLQFGMLVGTTPSAISFI